MAAITSAASLNIRPTQRPLTEWLNRINACLEQVTHTDGYTALAAVGGGVILLPSSKRTGAQLNVRIPEVYIRFVLRESVYV